MYPRSNYKIDSDRVSCPLGAIHFAVGGGRMKAPAVRTKSAGFGTNLRRPAAGNGNGVTDVHNGVSKRGGDNKTNQCLREKKPLGGEQWRRVALNVKRTTATFYWRLEKAPQVLLWKSEFKKI